MQSAIRSEPPAPSPVVRGPSGARTAVSCPETARRRRDDWARAFAARLAWLGAVDGAAELARLGRSLYEDYNLLDPYHIARMVWRRWPRDRGIVVSRQVP